MTEHLDRLDQIAACLRCLADLLAPETDLHAVNRDDLACTIGFLTAEYQAARAALDASRSKPLEHPHPVRVV